jgi:hypothetical protein
MALPIFSWIIMAAENVDFSHVYIKAFDDEIQEWVYYQASHDLVNLMTEQVFLSQEKVIHEYDFTISDAAFEKMKKFVMDNMGKAYSLKEVLGLAIVQILSYFGVSINNPFSDNTGFVCSVFVAAALDDLSQKNILFDLANATPKNMLAIVSQLPKDLNVGS